MSVFKSVLANFNTKLWGHHFIVPQEITEQYIIGDNRRVIIRINNSEEIRSALMPINKVESFILVNKEVRTKHSLIEGEEATIEIEKDHSKYGMDMPEELNILFDQELEAKQYFEALTPGKQRALIYLVTKVKNTNSRLNKALAIVHHLKEVNGKLDFKMLNETIKHYNSRGKLAL